MSGRDCTESLRSEASAAHEYRITSSAGNMAFRPCFIAAAKLVKKNDIEKLVPSMACSEKKRLRPYGRNLDILLIVGML